MTFAGIPTAIQVDPVPDPALLETSLEGETDTSPQ